MSNFKFTCTAIDGSVNTLEFTADSITNVVDHFEQFLRGSGFHFEGHLDLCHITEPMPENWDECSSCTSGPCVSEEQAGIDGYITKEELNKWQEQWEDMVKQPKTTVNMPGTIGSATLTFPEERCNVRGCGLTRDELGEHTCYETNCGLR